MATTHLSDSDDADHHRGLHHDLERVMRRRSMLKFGALGGLAAVAATRIGRTAAAAADLCTKIPEETAGPYPGDGTNGVNVLNVSGIVRSDIRSSFGTSTTMAAGVPLTIRLKVTDSSTCADLVGAAVYLWHCDREGRYSLYSTGVTGENYLRGVQQTDSKGEVVFTSIFPACYSGRWPHIHFEVYPSLTAATSGSGRLATSQLALPKASCDLVFATTGYSASISNLNQVTLANDNVFRDDQAIAQLATMSGGVGGGFTAALTVPVMTNGSTTSTSTTTPATTTTSTTTVPAPPPDGIAITPTTTPAAIGVASAYSPLATPQRLLDTRGTSASKPGAGSTTLIDVLGRGGVPASGVSAVVLNVTATEATAPGFVTAWADGTRPTASVLNLERTGHTRANLTTVPVGADGRVRLFTDAGAHLIVDVFGYFAPATAAAAGRLRTVTPGRLLDTRFGSLVGYLGTKPSAGQSLTLAINGRQGVPPGGISAVVLNITATDATAPGYVTAWAGGTRPATSNLNIDRAGETIANQVIIPVAADGTIQLFTERGSHLIVDVSGYYTDASAQSGTDGLFTPVSPYRVMDTRSLSAKPSAGATITLLAAAAGTAAAGRKGFAMNVTATDATAPGYVTVWPSLVRPIASNVNISETGGTISNHVVSATGPDGEVRLYTETATHLVADVTGWYS